METQLSVIMNDIKKLWNGLEFMQKLVIMLLLVASIFAVSFITIKSMEPDWGVLYSDLSETDANAVIETLKKSGYPFKFSDDRKTVLVPLKAKEELRLMIAQNDVIQDSNPGFELLNKMQFGATDFQNKLTRQKIFQDELTRTIEKIRGIQKARVQIAEPDRSVFADKDEKPTASVMLIIESGAKLKTDQIKAIKNLVAYGIPRLTPENVFVTDQSGVNLAEDSEGTGTSSGDDYKSQFEKDTVKKVQKVIQNIVGIGNVSVEVSADINFDRTKTTTEKYLPASDANGVPIGVLSTVKDESEIYDKGQKTAETADSEATTPDSGASGKNYEKIKTSKNYNISKEVSQVIYAPGKVQRLTIAVALNKILTTKEKDEIKKLVISASGADETRGDIITITGMQFAMNPEEEGNQMYSQMDKASSQQILIQTIAPLIVILTLGLGALFVLSSLLKKPITGEIYDSGRYYDDESSDERAGMLTTGENVQILGATMDPVLEKIKTDINSTILADPKEAARLLQSFIKD